MNLLNFKLTLFCFGVAVILGNKKLLVISYCYKYVVLSFLLLINLTI